MYHRNAQAIVMDLIEQTHFVEGTADNEVHSSSS
jgi:hypothetical protein